MNQLNHEETEVRVAIGNLTPLVGNYIHNHITLGNYAHNRMNHVHKIYFEMPFQDAFIRKVINVYHKVGMTQTFDRYYLRGWK